MSTVECEACGTTAERPLTHPAPVGWLYLAAHIPGVGDVYVYACTLKCSARLWREGPGSAFPAVIQAVKDRIGNLP